LRHSYATHCIEAGINLSGLQQFLGHQSILTTTRYTHLTSHQTETAVERLNVLMNRLDIHWGAIK
jgi:site-specific recombinase XerD